MSYDDLDHEWCFTHQRSWEACRLLGFKQSHDTGIDAICDVATVMLPLSMTVFSGRTE